MRRDQKRRLAAFHDPGGQDARVLAVRCFNLAFDRELLLKWFVAFRSSADR